MTTSQRRKQRIRNGQSVLPPQHSLQQKNSMRKGVKVVFSLVTSIMRYNNRLRRNKRKKVQQHIEWRETTKTSSHSRCLFFYTYSQIRIHTFVFFSVIIFHSSGAGNVLQVWSSTGAFTTTYKKMKPVYELLA